MNPFKNTFSKGPIGLFDSGAGGLFVLNNLIAAYPEEDFIFLADTANFPYGEKPNSMIELLARNCAKMLVDKGCRAIIVACNTASAFALDTLEKNFIIPIVGPIMAAAEEAKAKTKNGKIGVLATKATVRSKVYEKFLEGTQAIICESPLLAHLVQDGQLDLLESALHHYIFPMISAGVDTVILGCTHYPLVEKLLAPFNLQVVDSAKSFIPTLSPWMRKGGSSVEYIVTGSPLSSTLNHLESRLYSIK